MKHASSLPLKLALLALLAVVPCDARRHRYGHGGGHSKLSRDLRDTRSDLEMIHQRTRELASFEDEVRASMCDDSSEVVMDATAEGRKTRQWPPRWAQPMVLIGTIGYSVAFLNA